MPTSVLPVSQSSRLPQLTGHGIVLTSTAAILLDAVSQPTRQAEVDADTALAPHAAEPVRWGSPASRRCAA